RVPHPRPPPPAPPKPRATRPRPTRQAAEPGTAASPAPMALSTTDPLRLDGYPQAALCRIGAGAAVVAVVSRGSDGLALEPPADWLQPGLLTARWAGRGFGAIDRWLADRY